MDLELVGVWPGASWIPGGSLLNRLSPAGIGGGGMPPATPPVSAWGAPCPPTWLHLRTLPRQVRGGGARPWAALGVGTEALPCLHAMQLLLLTSLSLIPTVSAPHPVSLLHCTGLSQREEVGRGHQGLPQPRSCRLPHLTPGSEHTEQRCLGPTMRGMGRQGPPHAPCLPLGGLRASFWGHPRPPFPGCLSIACGEHPSIPHSQVPLLCFYTRNWRFIF